MNEIKTNIKFMFFLLSFLLICTNFKYIWSKVDGWLLKVDDNIEFKIKEFEDQFKASISLQTISQPFVSPKDILVAKQNKQLKKMFLENLINDILIKKELKSNNLLDENYINKESKKILNVIKRGLIRQVYISKVQIPKAKEPSKESTKLIYERIKDLERFKSYTNLQLYKIAKQQAYYTNLKEDYMENLIKLREKYKIKIKEEFIDNLE